MHDLKFLPLAASIVYRNLAFSQFRVPIRVCTAVTCQYPQQLWGKKNLIAEGFQGNTKVAIALWRLQLEPCNDCD